MAKRKHKPPDAPRLKAYLAKAESRRILQMPRSEWGKVKPKGPGKVLVDVQAMPIGKVAQDAAVIAATAECVGSSGYEVNVYRYDPADANDYNVDRYSVWEGLGDRSDFEEIVAAASTDIDDNMRAFLNENVFMVSIDKDAFHWLDEEQLPTLVRLQLPTKSSEAD